MFDKTPSLYLLDLVGIASNHVEITLEQGETSRSTPISRALQNHNTISDRATWT